MGPASPLTPVLGFVRVAWSRGPSELQISFRVLEVQVGDARVLDRHDGSTELSLFHVESIASKPSCSSDRPNAMMQQLGVTRAVAVARESSRYSRCCEEELRASLQRDQGDLSRIAPRAIRG